MKYERLLNKLLAQPPLRFADMKPSDLPLSKTAGVYLIAVRGESYYVGRTKNLRRRLPEHLNGPPQSARLKKYLVAAGECADWETAKQFLREHASVRRLEEPDMRQRYFLECYATAMLEPKYGISEEH
jgi:predicted GIY-YIG superfamily endonuclease